MAKKNKQNQLLTINNLLCEGKIEIAIKKKWQPKLQTKNFKNQKKSFKIRKPRKIKKKNDRKKNQQKIQETKYKYESSEKKMKKKRQKIWKHLKESIKKWKQNLKKENNEIKGDIHIFSSRIKPIKAAKDYYVNSTDEYPILFVIAALTNGISVFKGINDLAM